MNTRIYFDNAATTYPKPEPVYQAQDVYFRHSGNPGRGAHQLAVDSARMIFDTRVNLAEFLGIADPQRLVFTPGCTHSINMALKGLRLASGDVVLTSALEHNSVMRPLNQLKLHSGIQVQNLPYAETGVVNLSALKAALVQFRPRLCVVSQASNVTGELVDIASAAEVCRELSVPLMVDAAQSAGFTDQKIDALGIGLWCASGHKGLMGAPGVGLLYVSPEVVLEPLIAGGTGSNSEHLDMPAPYPDHLEAGTVAGPAIAALQAGVTWLKSVGLKAIRRHEDELVVHFMQAADTVPSMKIYGSRQGTRTGIVAFNLEAVTADRLADILDTDYGIAVRSGLHCAAAAHSALGTLESGVVRASFGYFNKVSEVQILTDALREIAARK